MSNQEVYAGARRLGVIITWWGIGIFAAAMLGVFLFGGCAAPAPAQGGLEPAASRVVVGRLTSVERDSRYEQRCGVLCRLTGGESARAYAAVVTDSAGHEQYFWFFALDGNVIPHVGDAGAWVLHRRVIYDVDRCNSYGCPSFPDWQLDRLEDGPQP